MAWSCAAALSAIFSTASGMEALWTGGSRAGDSGLRRNTRQEEAPQSVCICLASAARRRSARTSRLSVSLASNSRAISASRARAWAVWVRACAASCAVETAATRNTPSESQSRGSATVNVPNGGRKKKSQQRKLRTAPKTAGPKPNRIAQAITTGRYSSDACPLSSVCRSSQNPPVGRPIPAAAHSQPGFRRGSRNRSAAAELGMKNGVGTLLLYCAEEKTVFTRNQPWISFFPLDRIGRNDLSWIIAIAPYSFSVFPAPRRSKFLERKLFYNTAKANAGAAPAANTKASANGTPQERNCDPMLAGIQTV